MQLRRARIEHKVLVVVAEEESLKEEELFGQVLVHVGPTPFRTVRPELAPSFICNGMHQRHVQCRLENPPELDYQSLDGLHYEMRKSPALKSPGSFKIGPLGDDPSGRPQATLVGAARFELAASASRTQRSSQAELRPEATSIIVADGVMRCQWDPPQADGDFPGDCS